jgi:hypothetical protein
MTNKEQFIEATGGFRLGESPAQFKKRQAEIGRIERQILSGHFSEKNQRRLCELKGIDFDSYDLEDHPSA